MYFVFADDSRVNKPTRAGMEHRSFVAVGGFAIEADQLLELERGLEAICAKYGFPKNEEFKWSPSRDSWMHHNLVGSLREQFFIEVLEFAKAMQVKSTVIVVDTAAQSATGASTPEFDAVELFLERTSNFLNGKHSAGVIIVDQPSGNRKAEKQFLADTLDAIERGTEYVQHENIAIVLTGNSNFVRCLQLADLITGCTTQRVGGEATYSPVIFEKVKATMMKAAFGGLGGAGLKIHPDLRYANLYYWLLGDDEWYKRNSGVTLPRPTMLYSKDEGVT